MYICTYMFVSIHTYAYTYIHTHTYVHTYVHTHNIRTYVHNMNIHTYMHSAIVCEYFKNVTAVFCVVRTSVKLPTYSKISIIRIMIIRISGLIQTLMNVPYLM